MSKNNNRGVLDVSNLFSKDFFTNKSVSQVHDFYLVGTIRQASDYLDWFEIIRNANENDVVRIHINSYGGDLFTAIQMIRVLNECPGTVITSVEGACMSAATMIFLNADAMEVSPHSMFMFHNYSGGAFGKGGEMFEQLAHERVWSENMMRDVYSGFLKKKEITSMMENKDIWMDGEEVLKRLNKKAKKIQKEIEQ